MGLSIADQKALARDLARFEHDPYGFVMYVYPWGKPGGPLANFKGPRKWQRDYLCAMRDRMKGWGPTGSMVDQEGTASGNGIGKSTMISWLVEWSMNSKEFTRGFTTAGTEGQLTEKLWPELRKWHSISLCRHWFELAATSYHSSISEDHKARWRMDIVPWNKARPEAMSGMHNKSLDPTTAWRVVKLFEEASQIPDEIWDMTAGADTDEDTEIIHHAFGNPTRKSGRFADICFGVRKEKWHGKSIDSGDVEGTNKTLFQSWVDEYGEDSDFVRVHRKGLLPSSSSLQFIPSNYFEMAARREVRPHRTDPVVVALDVAAGGGDFAVFRFRWGDDMKNFDPIRIPASDLKKGGPRVLIAKVADIWRNPRIYGLPRKFDLFVYDETGVGWGLRTGFEDLKIPCMGFKGADASPNKEYANMRAYAAGQFREALRTSAAVDPKDEYLRRDIDNQEGTINGKGQTMLVRKEHMRIHGIPSPDDLDSASMLWVHDIPKMEDEEAKARLKEDAEDRTEPKSSYQAKREERRNRR